MTFVHFKDLKAYKLAYGCALRIYELTKEFPADEKRGLVSQMRRASTSVCANMAEGLSKRGSVADEIRFLNMAMGSCAEMQVWLDFTRDLHLSSELEECSKLEKDYLEVAMMVHGLILRREESEAA